MSTEETITMIEEEEEVLEPNPLLSNATYDESKAAASSDDDRSGDDAEEDDVDEDYQSVIGISISQAQKRLASPNTPAAEKVQALEQHQEYFPSEELETLQDGGSEQFIPDDAAARPWHEQGRTRAKSTAISERFGRKFGSFSIASLHKSLESSRHSVSSLSSWLPWNDRSNESSSMERQNSDDPLKQSTTTETHRNCNSMEATQSSPTPLLRRTTSADSLFLRKALSHASSLGDDERWSNVHGQVNSRFKAIRDTIQDGSLKIPRIPALPGLNIGAPLRSNSPDSHKGSRGSTTSRGSLSFSNTFFTSRTAEEPTSMSQSKPQSLRKPLHPKHPYLTVAVDALQGHVVILGGYRGSILRSAEVPNRQIWVPLKVGLNIRKVNLEVGLDADADMNMTKTVIPSGMLRNVGPVDISRKLFRHLEKSPNVENGKLRVWDWGYDWRLNPRLLSDQLIEFLESLPSNSGAQTNRRKRTTIIAHSLGGLITRHAVNRRPDLFSSVIYAGVPQTCVNILGPLRHGDDVLLSSRVLTAQVNFSFRTSFALLPLDGKCFFNPETKEEFPVDFFDENNWESYCLSPCIARPIPLPERSASVVGNLVSSMASVIPVISLPGKRNSISRRNETSTGSSVSNSDAASTGDLASEGNSIKQNTVPAAVSQELAYGLHPSTAPTDFGHASDTGVSTSVTIPKAEARAYLRRVLQEVKAFKEELAFNPAHAAAGKYPPVAVIYGKAIPTVYGAQVQDREAIKRADAYDNLAFASGDGVVLARAAQLPPGYQAVKGGVISSDRGHVSLLGDLEAVGKCLYALNRSLERLNRVQLNALGG